MPNRVYRGPSNRQPNTIGNRTVAGPYLPCTAVLVGWFQLTQANDANSGRIALLSNRDWYGSFAHASSLTDPLLIPYATGETGEAYVLEAGQYYLWAMAAGTYANGQPLTVGAGGRLTAASAGNVVVAYYDQANATLTGGVLADVVIA